MPDEKGSEIGDLGLARRVVNHRLALRIKRPQAHSVLPVVAEFPVCGVLDQVDLALAGPALGDFHQGRPSLGRHGHPAGVVVVGGHVDRLHPAQLAGGFQAGQLVLERLGDQAVLVDLDPEGPGAQIA